MFERVSGTPFHRRFFSVETVPQPPKGIESPESSGPVVRKTMGSGLADGRPENTDTLAHSIRVCHLADVHLGYRRYNKLARNGQNQREVDVNHAFQESISRIISLKPDVVVIAGDLFHSVRPSNYVVTFCFRQLRKLTRETGAPVIIVGGNHEAPKRTDTGSVLQLLGEIEGVHVADSEIETFTFKGISCSVTCIPHLALLKDPSHSQGEGVVSGSNKSSLQHGRFQLRANDACKHNILVVHAQVNEDWVSDFGGVELDLRALSPHEWDYIALGHVHLHRQVGLNAAYSGALEHTANNIWAEAKEVKGFLEVHLPSAKRTFHPLTTPRDVVVLEPLDALEMTPEWVMDAVSERINAVAGGIDGKIARLDIRNISRETYRNLNHKELRALKAKALNLSIDISFVSSTPAAHAVGRPGKGLLRDELQAFCATWQVPGVTHEELSSVLLSYVTKIEAKYEAS